MILKNVTALLIALCVANNIFTQVLEIPELTNVSVDINTQTVNISWKMSDADKVDGYIIKRQIFGYEGVVDGSVNTIATINNRNQYSYIDNKDAYGYAMPSSRVESYRVVAFKNTSGGKVLYSNMSRQVSTIYLSPIKFDLCNKQNKLEWTAYNGFANNLKAYKIYYSHSLDANPVFVGEVDASTTTFTHSNIELLQKYYYHIEAVSNSSLTSNSNRQLVITKSILNSKIMNADYATVIEKNKAELSFSLDKTAKIKSYILLKSDKINGKYDTVSIFKGGVEKITYIDTLKTSKYIKYYKLAAVNECGEISGETNIANNIVLKAKASTYEKLINNLSWNAYENWRGGVKSYNIYRSFNGEEFEKIATLTPNNLNFDDNIKHFLDSRGNVVGSTGKFCYYIEAEEDKTNPYGIIGKSKSNVKCTYQEAIVYLPNAINPNSQFAENRTFRPFTTFVSDYQLIIYDRWGGIVFKSTDPLKAWDGTNNGGNLLMKGTYTYFLQYKSKNKTVVKTSGEINLIY